jgi:hypothetical protein
MRKKINNPGFRLPQIGPAAIVCGSGPSLKLLLERADFGELETVGVNDNGIEGTRYLVTCDSPEKVTRYYPERAAKIQAFPKERHYAGKDGYGVPQENRYLFGIRDGSLPNWGQHGVFDYSITSPFIAILLAAAAGAKMIGMIGVDFKGPHYWEPEGAKPHCLANKGNILTRDILQAQERLAREGVRIWNLSPDSTIEIRRHDLGEWIQKYRPYRE